MSITQSADWSSCANPVHSIPLLTAYNPAQTDNYYSINPTDMEEQVLLYGYQSRGNAGGAFTSQVGATVPLHHLFYYSSATGNDNFYTTNATERDVFIAQKGYTDRGIAAYVYETQICGSVPLFRSFNPVVVDHFYTNNLTEDRLVSTTKNYVQEGIQCYVVPDPTDWFHKH
ncbi:predicted protein [Postia placenta Mad-698-R]|nr:predicted protein [Postia placenta Mad-698-R]